MRSGVFIMHALPSTARPSTVGRPRRLSDADIAEILAWHAQRRTVAQVAAHYGISTALLHDIIRSGGRHYKQPSPEQRASDLAARHGQQRRLRAGGWL
jgi:hypothetical protein